MCSQLSFSFQIYYSLIYLCICFCKPVQSSRVFARHVRLVNGLKWVKINSIKITSIHTGHLLRALYSCKRIAPYILCLTRCFHQPGKFYCTAPHEEVFELQLRLTFFLRTLQWHINQKMFIQFTYSRITDIYN